MKKQAEEIAKDLETVDFAEIADQDLQDIFGSQLSERSPIDRRPIDVNCNCCC